MTEYEAFARLRRPLPRWWWGYGPARLVGMPEAGISFDARRGEGSYLVAWRCFVARRTLELISRGRLSDRRLMECWGEHGPRFEVAARRKIEAERWPAARVVEVRLSDLGLD